MVLDFDRLTCTVKLPMPVYKAVLARVGDDPTRNKRLGHYCLFLSVLSEKLRDRFREIRRNGDGQGTWFCSMSSVILHSMLGNCYTGILRDLESWGIIWRSASYMVGTADCPGKCKSFCFGSPYAGYVWRYHASREEYYADTTGTMAKFGKNAHVRIKDHCLLKRIYLYMAGIKADQMRDPMVRKCHDELAGHFSIDREKAKDVVAGLVADRRIGRAAAKRELDKVDRFNSAGSDEVSLYVKRDQYGRIHTNMTNLKKEIRRDCLLCDGAPVASVDIKSSQGAFLCAILGKFAGVDGLKVHVEPYLDKVVHRCAWLDRELVRSEYLHYRDLLAGGRLYEFFAGELAGDLDVDRPVERKEAKKEFLAMLFAPIHIDGLRNPVRAAVRRVWERYFPNLLRCLDELKRTSYAALAHLMQKVESSFVYDRVIPAVEAEVGCHFCTVHDSLVVPESAASAVKAVMDRELGMCSIPTVTEEEYAVLYPDPQVARHMERMAAELSFLPDDEELAAGV